MSDKIHITHDSMISNLVAKYKQAGYKVITEPGPQDLPFSLENYRPDLLAQKGDEGYIIEVKTNGTRVPIERYSDIAKLISRHPGWRFLFVTEKDQLVGGQSTIGGELFSWEQISNRAEQFTRLFLRGEIEPAFLSLWVTFEALLRRQAIQVSLPIERFPSSALIKQLYSQGELSISQFDQVLALCEIRNRLVHGFQTANLGESARQLGTLLQELLRIWKPSV